MGTVWIIHTHIVIRSFGTPFITVCGSHTNTTINQGYMARIIHTVQG